MLGADTKTKKFNAPLFFLAILLTILSMGSVIYLLMWFASIGMSTPDMLLLFCIFVFFGVLTIVIYQILIEKRKSMKKLFE